MPKGGIEWGFLPAELTKILTLKKEGMVSDPAGRFWGPVDLPGPVLFMGFAKGEAATPIGTATYHGIDGLAFKGFGGFSTSLDFAAIGLLEADDKFAAAAKISIKVAEVGGGVATDV